ncbi:cytochrome c [Flavobacteriales bacterium]|nr:cytochrome c [Flavobacteriales bacterium]
MVVLREKNIKELVLILLLTAGVLASCSEDRLIDVEPYIYATEYWKKDSLVYTLLLDNDILNQQITPYGISSPDTLSLFYETQEYTLTFLEENKDSVFVGVTNGQFEFVSDSLFLYNQDTLKQRVFLKKDSLLVLETTLISGNYVRSYKYYYSLINFDAEVPMVSFRNDIYTPIFESRCMPCHSSDGGQIILAPADLAYENMINGVSKNDGGVAFINILQPEESYLYRLVADDNVEYIMPPGNNALTPFEIQAILNWISQGAQDN